MWIIIKLFLNIIINIESIFQLIKLNSEVGKTENMAKTKKSDMKVPKTGEKTHTFVKKTKQSIVSAQVGPRDTTPWP